MIDSNLFIAAVKGRWTKSSELLSTLLDSPVELVANKALLSEYEKYARVLDAEYIFDYLKSRLIIINQSEEEVVSCRQFFPVNQAADVVHAATCLHARAVLISNDRHFEKIREAGIIEVWTISEAIKNLLIDEVE
ncbi:MAG: PIN domain-containing protein [Methanothrix sp.]|nr:PIN domain-containing protein [Methanothrix sp.]